MVLVSRYVKLKAIGSARVRLRCGSRQFENDFSVAQAFTPGNKEVLVSKAPINGACEHRLVLSPGVNALPRRKRLGY
jgi:hypothetical protein